MSKILFTIQHPADVNLFRNTIKELEKRNHDVYVFAREKDVNTFLLNRYNIDHEVLTGKSSGIFGTVKMQLIYEFKLFRRAMQIQPDVMVSDGGIAISHISSVMDSPSLVFTDTEHVVDSLINRRHLIYRFSDEVHTPECYWLDLGDNHHRYPGYHELAYLYPGRFEPDPTIRETLGIEENKQLALLRLVSWDAFHDRGHQGISNPGEIIDYLQQQDFEVLISSEGEIPKRYAHFELDLPAKKLYSLMYELDLFVGESPTMTAEAAMLGTPAILITSLENGYISELEHEYDLVAHLNPSEEKYAVDVMEETLEQSEEYWKNRRQKLLDDKKDTTNYILEQINKHIDCTPSIETTGSSTEEK